VKPEKELKQRICWITVSVCSFTGISPHSRSQCRMWLCETYVNDYILSENIRRPAPTETVRDAVPSAFPHSCLDHSVGGQHTTMMITVSCEYWLKQVLRLRGVTTTNRFRFDRHSTAYQRSLRLQWRNPLAAVTLIYLFIYLFIYLGRSAAAQNR